MTESRGRVEDKADILSRKNGEILARYANCHGGAPGATRVDGDIGHGLGRVDVRERSVGRYEGCCRMDVRGRLQPPEVTDENDHTESDPDFGEAIALQFDQRRACRQTRREMKFIDGRD